MYKSEWRACEGTTVKQRCPGNSTGDAYWTCIASPFFDEPQPNYSGCGMIWLSDLVEKIDNVRIADFQER